MPKWVTKNTVEGNFFCLQYSDDNEIIQRIITKQTQEPISWNMQLPY